MNDTIRMYWKTASTIAARHEYEPSGVATMFAYLASLVIEVFDTDNPTRRRYRSSLTARHLEKDILSHQRCHGLTEEQATDLDSLRNCLRYAESVFAEALGA